MTLIIGCITPDFGIISGDTQLTIGCLDRGTDLRRDTMIKIDRPSPDITYGIMGKWSHYQAVEDDPGKVFINNYYEILRENLRNEDNKLEYLTGFLEKRTDLDATMLVISKDREKNFTIHQHSSLPNRELSILNIGNVEYRFNEPFSSAHGSYIKSIIENFHTANSISETLIDQLFLLNNVLLDVISKGFNFTLLGENGSSILYDGNTVGGYVTMSVVTKDENSWNTFYKSYSGDKNTLLDGTTTPFSRYVDQNKSIRYVDNLSMLVRSINDPFHSNITLEIKELVLKQIRYIHDQEVLSKTLLNRIIQRINGRFEMDLPLFKEEPNKEEPIDLLEIIFDNDVPQPDYEYLERFI
jgi:hypothetical protein